MVNEQALLADLVEAIHAWIEASRSRSLSSLARRTNVAYSTIRRIAQNESVPHPYTALAIVEVVMALPQRVEFLKKHFPTIGNLLDSCYDDKMRREPHDESLRRFLQLEPHNRIFNMAATNAGITRATIERLAGSMGLDALEEMLDEGLLAEEDGLVKYSANSWALTNVDDALNQIRHSAGHFEKQLIGTDGASLMHASGAIKPEFVPRLKELVAQFCKDVTSLKNDPKVEGGVPFFCDLMYSLYDRQDWQPLQEQDR